MRMERRARAEGLVSESSVVINAEFRKIRPAAIKIKPAVPSCNSGQGEASSQKALMNIYGETPENRYSKPHKGLAAYPLRRFLPGKALGSPLFWGQISLEALRLGANHEAAFSLRGGYDAISLICAGGMRILTCSCRGGASSTVGRSRTTTSDGWPCRSRRSFYGGWKLNPPFWLAESRRNRCPSPWSEQGKRPRRRH